MLTPEVESVLHTRFVVLMSPPYFVFPVFLCANASICFYGLFSVPVYFCLQTYSFFIDTWKIPGYFK